MNPSYVQILFEILGPGLGLHLRIRSFLKQAQPVEGLYEVRSQFKTKIKC